ncbi:IS701 family transposase [Spongiactinospora sp. TRM90649]|uniref:IS701 family transposase n=1 Tax=Spongiactinospora sp. TRM90649 TaxID=3031114 RepID=UPI0023F8354E|nr:IS701 family transposase [Spongiactinospora sp. TRM90649]MDF5754610.1 IS701 family transposase [Spongiactinospora sp. TRM90649]
MVGELTPDDLQEWVSGLNVLFGRVACRFGRVEPRRQARAYVTGLLAPIERKNGWQLAEAAGDAAPDRMQRLLNSARWDPREVRVDLRDYVMDNLGHRDGVLIVDETGFLKKGDKSAGVQRQYSGTAGRVENCQLGVFLAYASPSGRALIDAELYLPKSWTDDRVRCAQARIGEEVQFATKPMLARMMLTRALKAGVPASWVTADEAYGMDFKFRRFLEEHHLGYVVAVPKNQWIGQGWGGQIHAGTATTQAPPEAWKRRSCGNGAKGPRLYDWALATVHFETEPGYQRQLLVRRSLTPNAKGELELAYYLCHAPVGTALEDLIAVAGARWAIEECFQSAKNETGLDQYQVRRFDAWHRHITLAMLAHAYLAVTAAHAPKAQAAWSASHPPRSVVSWHT